MKTYLGGALFLFTTLVVSSCGESTDDTKSTAPRQALSVQAVVVNGVPFDNDIIATANILPNEQVDLKAPSAGTVLSIFFKEGEKVKKGDLIVKLDDREWKAQLIGLSAEFKTAEQDLKRKQSLLEIEGSSQEQVDQAQVAIDKLKSQIQQLQVKVNLANIRAPFSGKMGMRNFSLGAYLKEGDLLTTLTEVSTLKVDFALPEEYIHSVKVGKTIRVIVSRDTLKADVYAIGPMINSSSRTINVRATLLQPKDKDILPGSFGEVLISTNFIESAILVPSQAIVPEINDQTVFLYKGGKAKRVKVQLGTRTSDMTHVISGVQNGDTVLTTGLLQIKDGADVSLKSVKK